MTQRFYSDTPSNITGPACGLYAITPHNTNPLPAVTRGIYVGVSGDVVVVPAFGDATPVKFASVPAGSILPIMVTKVLSTDTVGNTTAQSLVALY